MKFSELKPGDQFICGPHTDVFVKVRESVGRLPGFIIPNAVNGSGTLVRFEKDSLVKALPSPRAVAFAFLDRMDGQDDHDIHRDTGLPHERCAQIGKLRAELAAAYQGQWPA